MSSLKLKIENVKYARIYIVKQNVFYVSLFSLFAPFLEIICEIKWRGTFLCFSVSMFQLFAPFL